MNERKRKPSFDISNVLGKLPPSNLELEKAIIGTVLQKHEIIAKYPYLKPEVFYNESHGKIYKAICDLYNKDIKPDLILLTDHLRITNQLEEVGSAVYITQLSGFYIPEPDMHIKVLMQKYFHRKLIEISYTIQNDSFMEEKDATEIIDEFQNSIMNLMDFDVEIQNNFAKSLERTLNDIKYSSDGENITVIKTGFKEVDKRFTFRTRYVCVIAGPEASGKTKFTISLIRGMLDNEPDLAVQWFSFEDDRSQIIRAFLSMDVRKTTKELQSINYKMTKKDIDEVNEYAKKYEKYNIEFYDRATSIANIVSRAKRFSDKYKHKKKIIVIDNLGLIECDKVGVERDDHIAAKIKSIADNNNASIILVHHFTKEIARKANLEDGYRPRKEYLKGSTRILDYVQQALFVNLCRKYPDLLGEEKQIELEFLRHTEIEFTESNFDKYLWSINSQPDKDTEKVHDLRIETFVKIKNLLDNAIKLPNGDIVTFSCIVQKYTEYSKSVDVKNKGQEERWKKPKQSIYSFIVKRKFNENYIVSESSPRSLYLYGHNKNLKHHIDDLFIVECVKNRDDDNLGDSSIFRFICDLGYNTFKEADNG